MTKAFLYHQIAEAIRQDVLEHTLRAGDRLPTVREMAEQWGCTIGTVQRAYEELAGQGVVVSRPGQGTYVANVSALVQGEPLRRAHLVHLAEGFLLEALTAGYTQAEIEQALRLALDRWRALHRETVSKPAQTLRFVGSHDPALALITTLFADIVPDVTLQLAFSGSLGGLIALAEGKADLAGIHLWDEESQSYNIPFVRRLLPGRPVVVLTLAHRHLGLISAPASDVEVTQLADLTRPQLRFINRQPGAGTRVWLDARLHQLGIDAGQIAGYTDEVQTHSEVARAIAEGQADIGLAVETAAAAYGLPFVPLTTERYDLVIPAAGWNQSHVQTLAHWLTTEQARQKIAALGGYEVTDTGRVEWLLP